MKMRRMLVLLCTILGCMMSAAAQTDRQEVIRVAERVNDWFMRQWPDPTMDTYVRNKVRPSSLWTRAVYYEGLMALHTVAPQQRYLDYTLTWCNHHRWTPRNGVNTHDADDYCCSQTYIDMYRMGMPGATLQYVRQNADNIIARGAESDPDWWWIDAIQMGMPVFARLARTTGDERYAQKAWSMYEYTRNQQDGGMRNPQDGLWWRDRDFNPPYTTPGGRNCYWSRGDGWVVAALVRVLDEMKPTDAHYGDYLSDLTSMLQSLVPLQRADGFWNCSLADPTDFGGPEVTGTSLFLYGMAWCVRHGHLPAQRFMPVMQRAWQAMASCVHPDGFLGWQQGTGKQPSDSQPVTFTRLPDFDDYGVGCFLLGAAEYHQLLSAGQPSVSQPALAPAVSTARPGVRWWWLGSAVTPEGIRWNMEQFASKGIGSVEITPIYGVQGNDANNIDFLSPRWMKMLGVCINEGKRLGIQVDMNCGTGWPFGGPQVPIEEAACKLVVVERTFAKASDVTTLPAPQKEAPYATLIAQRTFKTRDGIRAIAWYQSRTRQQVKRAAPGGQGYVIDHFDANAVRHYLERFDHAFAQSGVPYPATFFNDSYEVYEADWTPTLLQEFRQRRGYDLLKKMQEFTDGDPTVVSDYRETLSDLLLQNFTRQWADWAHQRGVQVRNQAHGSPANLIDVYSAVDIPEIEGFGLSELGIKGLRTDPGKTKKNDSDLSMLKYAASAAHVMGRPYASSETFTWLTEHFRTSLSQMKPDMDLMFCAGVNRMYFHGACYSPQGEPWPGWRFYASVDMTPYNSIWRDADQLTHYITTCQSQLQEGEPDNDFLVLLPVRDMWRDNLQKHLLQFDIHSMGKKAPAFIASILRIDSLGYDCDYISEELLMGCRWVDGMLQTAAGTRYCGLIIPGSATLMSKDLTKHIHKLQKQGAPVIYDITAANLSAAARPEPMKQHGLHMIRRRVGDGYRYFVSNLTASDVHQAIPLSVTAMANDVDLRSGESMFIDVDAQGHITQRYLQHRAMGTPQLLADLTAQTWTLRFVDSQPRVDNTFRLPRLQTWETLPHDSLRSLMGTGVYQTTFAMPSAPDPDAQYRIDLGDVRESARLYLNGRYVGTAWAHPMTIDFPGWMLQRDQNQLTIQVTNLPANRIAEYDRRGIPWRHFNEINVVDINYKNTRYDQWQPMPSGLNSTVKLYKMQ